MIFTPTAFFNTPAPAVAAGPPSFYTVNFGQNVITPFFAMNNGGFNSSDTKWKQWGSYSGSCPAQVSSSAQSGSGTITYDTATQGYIFNGAHTYWLPQNPTNGAFWTGSWGPPAGLSEQCFAYMFQGVIPTTAALVPRNYIWSAGNDPYSTFFGGDIYWNTGSVTMTVGSSENAAGDGNGTKRFSGSFTPGVKYNVMITAARAGSGNGQFNMFYAPVDANGISGPPTASSTGPFNTGNDGYNFLTYFSDSRMTARIGRGCIATNATGNYLACSASIHAFYGFIMNTSNTYISTATGLIATNPATSTTYVAEIFTTASLSWV